MSLLPCELLLQELKGTSYDVKTLECNNLHVYAQATTIVKFVYAYDGYGWVNCAIVNKVSQSYTLTYAWSDAYRTKNTSTDYNNIVSEGAYYNSISLAEEGIRGNYCSYRYVWDTIVKDINDKVLIKIDAFTPWMIGHL